MAEQLREREIEIDLTRPIIPRGPLGKPKMVLLQPTSQELEILDQKKCTCSSYRILGIQDQTVPAEQAEDSPDSHRTRQETESP